MLVFSDALDLSQINSERIQMHMDEAMAKKQAIYRQMADQQIQEVIAAMMSVSSIKQFNLNTTQNYHLTTTEIKDSVLNQSCGSSVLADSQDFQGEDDDDDD